MPTLQQLFRKPRKTNLTGRQKRRRAFRYGSKKTAPHKKGICMRVYTTSPKKPNSAIRKIAKVFLPSNKLKTLVAIPGSGHNLAQHSSVFIRGGRCRDIPGIQYKLLRNKYDFAGREIFDRKNRRSKFGLKNVDTLLKPQDSNGKNSNESP